MDEKQQELMFKLSMFEQQIKQLQEQTQAVEQAIVEMKQLFLGLDEFKKSEGKEILAPIGRGIFVKSKILTEDFLVDVGEGNFVKKDVEGTKEMIQKQVKKLEDAKEELEKNLNRAGEEVNELLRSVGE